MSRDTRAIADTASSTTPVPDLEDGLRPLREMVPSESEDGGAQAQESTSLPVRNDAVAGAGGGAQRRQLELAPIPRVRGLLRGAASEQFTPQIVPIGPYHVDNQVGSYLLQSTGVKDEEVQLIIQIGVDRKGLKDLVSSLVKDVRACYTHLPEGTMKDPEKFSEMLLLDGCYLLCQLIDFKSLAAGSSTSGGCGSSSTGASGSNICAGNGGGGGCGCLGSGSGSSSTGASGSSGGGGCCCFGSGSHGGDAGRHIAADQIRIDNDNTLVRDILYLLENQIPFPVLEAILNYICGDETKDYNHLLYSPVRGVLQQRKYISLNRERVTSSPMSKPSDLLHLVYSYIRRGPGDVLPAWSAQRRFLKRTSRWRRATDYRKYADLKFKCRKEFKEGQQWTILDLHIDGGTLYIPFLHVNHDTCTMLRNLMALEEKEQKRPVTAYCLFMSQVACTAEDVELLQGAGILEHLMPNDEEAANALANLCVGVVMDIDSLDRNYLKHLWHVLDMRCSKQVHNFKGFFRNKYCSTVFYRLVFLVAILLFVSNVGQAIYAVIAYHKPPHAAN